jgi:hypothetical protein
MINTATDAHKCAASGYIRALTQHSRRRPRWTSGSYMTSHLRKEKEKKTPVAHSLYTTIKQSYWMYGTAED